MVGHWNGFQNNCFKYLKRQAVYLKWPSMKIQRNWFRWCVSNDEAWKSTISLPIGCGQVSRLSPGSIVLENSIVQWKVYAGKTSLAHMMWENRQYLILHANNICCARTHSPSDHLKIFLDLVDWSFVVTFMPIFKNSANLIPNGLVRLNA